MIAKYNGRCRYCKNSAMAGVDQYDVETKTSYHEKCKEEDENRLPTLEELSTQHGLAERLGYKHYSWDQLLAPPSIKIVNPDANRGTVMVLDGMVAFGG